MSTSAKIAFTLLLWAAFLLIPLAGIWLNREFNLVGGEAASWAFVLFISEAAIVFAIVFIWINKK